MRYKTGENVEVGDSVLIEHGKAPGVVNSVVETDSDMKDWALNEQGIMIESQSFGLVFCPSSSDDPVVLESK